MPDWIDLRGPKPTRHGLAWDFTVRTDTPGQFLTSLAFECDTGVGRCQVSVEIKEGQPTLGDLVFCGSPFNGYTTHESLCPLVRMLRALPFRVHCLATLADLGGLRPRTILWHGASLVWAQSADVARLPELAAAGSHIVVLADEFYRGTSAAANRALAPFGLRLKQDGWDEPGVAQEERARRAREWHARYDSAPFDAGPGHICPHPLTQGVRRLHWFRPCPVVCTGGTAAPLVRSPADGSECFAAVAEAGGYVAVVGNSLWGSLAGVGWPYDNDRFFANLLVGGDADECIG